MKIVLWMGICYFALLAYGVGMSGQWFGALICTLIAMGFVRMLWNRSA